MPHQHLIFYDEGSYSVSTCILGLGSHMLASTYLGTAWPVLGYVWEFLNMYNEFIICADYCETNSTCRFMYSFFSYFRGIINVEVFLNFDRNWVFWFKRRCKWFFLRKLLLFSTMFLRDTMCLPVIRQGAKVFYLIIVNRSFLVRSVILYPLQILRISFSIRRVTQSCSQTLRRGLCRFTAHSEEWVGL